MHERRFQALRADRARRVLQTRQQQLDRARAELGRRLADDGQPRARTGRPTRSRRSATSAMSSGTRQAALGDRAQQADRHEVVAADDRGRRVGRGRAARASPRAAWSRCEPPSATQRPDRTGCPARSSAMPVAAHPLLGGAKAGDADRHRDPPCGRGRQVLDEPRGRLLVVAADLVERRRRRKRSSSTTGTLGGLEVRQRRARARRPTAPATARRPGARPSVRTIRSSCSGSSRVSPSSSVWPARPAAASTAATTSMKYGFESPLMASPSDWVPPRASARAIVFGR